MEITPFLVYLVGVIGDIKDAFAALSIIGGTGLLIAFVISIGDSTMNKYHITFKRSFIALIMMGTAALLLPDGKILAAMYVIPAIVNNERLTGLADKGIKVLELKTEEYINELTKEKAK